MKIFQASSQDWKSVIFRFLEFLEANESCCSPFAVGLTLRYKLSSSEVPSYKAVGSREFKSTKSLFFISLSGFSEIGGRRLKSVDEE